VPTVLYLVPAALCVCSWVGVGAAVPARLLTSDRLLNGLTRVGAGAIAVSLVLFALGRAHAFERWVLGSLTVLAAVAGIIWLVRRRDVPALPADRIVRVLLGVVALALVLDLAAATAPPTSADALKYHLALPQQWLDAGVIQDPFWRWEMFNPSAIEMLFAQGLPLGGGEVAAVLHAVFAALCAAAVFGLARELGSTVLGCAAASFLFVAQGIVTWEASSAFIELGLTFFTVLAVWHAVRWSRRPTRWGAAAVGVFAGGAAGTKYLGLLAAAVVLAACGAIVLVRRRWSDGAFAAAAFVAACGPWYLKNALVAHNPLYPFFFGGRWSTPVFEESVRSGVGDYGVGNELVRLPLLPFDLLAHGGAFDRGQYVGPVLLLLGIVAIATLRTTTAWVIAAASLVYLLAWAELGPQARFLLPLLAVFSALCGAALPRWLAAGPVARAAVFAVLVLTGAAWAASSGALTRQLLPVTVGAESRGHFVERLTGTHDALRAARARAGHGTIGLAGYPFVYLVPGDAIALLQPEFATALPRSTYLARLRAHGIRTVLTGNEPHPLTQLAPIRDCLQRVAAFPARFVTSRSLGTSEPFDFVLYSLDRCGL
jgi:hypothetical protein